MNRLDREAGEHSNGLQMAPESDAWRAKNSWSERIDGLVPEKMLGKERTSSLAGRGAARARPAAEEQAARDVATRLDHPNVALASVPTAPTWPGVLADFMAADAATRQRTEPARIWSVIDWLLRWIGYPESCRRAVGAARRPSLDAFDEPVGHPERAVMSRPGHSAQIRAVQHYRRATRVHTPLPSEAL